MEPLVHLLIPTTILYFLLPKHRKWVLILSFLTFIMDFDYFIPDYHRVFFHNLFFIIIISTTIFLILGKIPYFISLFYLFSHLIFDISDPGYAIFFPFSNTLYGLDVFIKKALVDGWNYKFSLIITPFGGITKFTQSHYFTNIGLILILFIILIFIINYFIKNENKT